MPTLEASKTKRRSRAGDVLAVLLLLAIVAGVGWLWWHQKHPQKHSHKPSSTSVQAGQESPEHEVIPSLVLVQRPVEAPVQPVEPQALLPPKPPESSSTEVPSNPPPITVEAPPAIPPLTPPPVPPVAVKATGIPLTEFPRPAKYILEAQVAMARLAISPGSIDGAIGSQTRAAFAAFQRQQKLVLVRSLDTNTESLLKLNFPILTTYTVTTNDLVRLQPIGKTWVAKSQQTALDYETILELVAEKAHAYPTLIQKLNPGTDWNHVAAGTVLKITEVVYPHPETKAAFVVIHLADKYLEAFGQETNLLAHFPCSIAAKVEKRPVGELHVAVVAPNPNYTFNPEIFPESPEAQAIGHKLVLPPGPNNPVGVAWIGLDRPGYGMHGTPSPEQIGRTESHGCFRLANWDAEYLVKLVWIGMPVIVEP